MLMRESFFLKLKVLVMIKRTVALDTLFLHRISRISSLSLLLNLFMDLKKKSTSQLKWGVEVKSILF